MERIINKELIRRIRKISRIEKLGFSDFAFYTNNWDRDYAQCLIAQAISLEKQVEMLHMMKNSWNSVRNASSRPEWFADFHRTLEIEEEMLTEPEAFCEDDESVLPKNDQKQTRGEHEQSESVLIPDEEQLPEVFDKIAMASHVLHLIDYSGVAKGSQATNQQWAAVLHLLTGGSVNTFRQKFGNPKLSDAAKSKIEAKYNAVLGKMKNNA